MEHEPEAGTRRVPTGIVGFDEITDAGKTIFGMQVLAHGASQMQEPGILAAFEESAARVTSAPLAEETPLNISSIADTWMHLSYVSQGGERNRALTIIKARGLDEGSA
jgi:hypothetical protein